MTENLHDLLKQDNPTALPRIERALISQDDLSADQEAVLGALIWQRCTSGAAGLLGCVTQQDCAEQIDRLPAQLDRIGASDAADALKELLSAIELDDDQIKSGLADWIDTQQDVINKAQELNADLDGIDGAIWAFMQDPHTDIPDLELASRKDFVLSSILGLFRLNKDDTL